MALTQTQQAIELIQRAERILIATRQPATTDALAAVASVLLFLNKAGKIADAVVQDFDPSKTPSFLRGLEAVRPTMGAVRAFEISLDVSQSQLDQLNYDVQDGRLKITLVPQAGEWSPKDVAFRHGQDRYDLVLALDCPDAHALGDIFREHADFLYRANIINIDRDPGNEHWGQLNLVDLTAVSTTEILFNLFTEWNRNLVDENIATSLLAGMIAKTQSFRTSNVSPKTLQTASELVAMGARREEIVHGLWRTRTVPTLKLWGRALSRLETDRTTGLVWTSLTRQDFIEAGTDEKALDGVVRELVAYAPESKIVVLFHECHEVGRGVVVQIHALPPQSASELGRIFGAHGSREQVDFNLGPESNLIDGPKMVIDRLRGALQNHG
jgi:phosphoesterase RecJ-like protein